MLGERILPWSGEPESLYEGTIRATDSGTAYVPEGGPLPDRSTWYWTPADVLMRTIYGDKVRYVYGGDPDRFRFSWVGMEKAPRRIGAGALVRVSLARLWSPPSAPAGYYVQLSGVY